MEMIQNLDRDRWWSVAEACPYATFFHTPLWNDLALIEDDTLADQTIGAELSNGTTIVLPLISVSPGGKHVGRRLRSTFAGSYGGVIADGPLTPEINELYKRVCNWRTVECKVAESPFCDETVGLSESTIDKASLKKDFTQVIPLDNYFEDVFDNFSKDRRYGVRKSKEKGVEVRQTTEISDFRDYFEAYQESLDRWENVSFVYSWDIIKNVQKMAEQNPEKIKLWVTEIDNKVASGAIVLYWNGHASYWHAASFSEYMSYYINDRIQAEIIEDAISRGMGYYDLLPSGGNEGVVKFKSQFGPEKWDIYRWTYQNRAFEYASQLKSTFDL